MNIYMNMSMSVSGIDVPITLLISSYVARFPECTTIIRRCCINITTIITTINLRGRARLFSSHTQKITACWVATACGNEDEAIVKSVIAEAVAACCS